MAKCGINIFDCHLSFFTGNSRNECCKLRNDVKKTPQFLLFSQARGGTKTIAHLSIVEGSNFWSLDRHIYECKLRNERKTFNPNAQ
jgi:hypothetical protein